MRVLFVPLPLPTHYLPTVGLAWALRLAGHQVRVATGAELADTVDHSGVPVVPVANRPDLFEAPEQNEKWLRLEHESPDQKLISALVNGPLDNYARIAAAMAEDLIALARSWQPDIVVFDPLAYAGPLAAAAAGAVPVRHLWGPDASRFFRLPGSGFNPDVAHPAVPWRALPWPARLLKLYEANGVAPRDDLAACTVDPCPPSLQYPGAVNSLAMRYFPYNGSGPIPAWLNDPPTRPRVCLTWGVASGATLGDEHFGIPKILRAVLDADLGVEIVVAASRRDAERIGDVPAGVRVGPVPMHALLPTCDLVIHHGGSGTMLTAASCGVPQLTLPTMNEQEGACRQLARQGSGLTLSYDDATAADIQAALADILDTGRLREAAGRLAAEISAQPAPTEVVERLTEQLRPSPRSAADRAPAGSTPAA
jgi:UDP:flavonoid glycosyltransferase YjiC (YdhE family)